MLLAGGLLGGGLLGGAAIASPQGADWLVIDTAEACGSCHLGSPDPTDSSTISIEGLPPRAVAGQSYPLRIVLSDPALQIAGFLLKVSAGNAPGDTGTLASVDATTETQGARARSTRAGALPRARGAMSWTVVWTAPTVSTDTIRFEIWANAGNDDLSPLGDRLHHRVWQVRAGD